MLLTTLSLFHLAGGLLARDQRNTILSKEAIPGPTQLRRYGLALLLIVAVTGLDFLNRIAGTTELSFTQWWICIGLAASLVVFEEITKAVLRRRRPAESPVPMQPALAT
jgi:P-type Ca2+ transporter type 2C